MEEKVEKFSKIENVVDCEETDGKVWLFGFCCGWDKVEVLDFLESLSEILLAFLKWRKK